MELCRIGEPLLRSNPSPLLSFLAPSVFPAWRPAFPFSSRTRYTSVPRRSQRLFSATTSPRAEPPKTPNARQRPESKAPQGVLTDLLGTEHMGNIRQAAPSVPPRRSDATSRISAKLDELFPDRPVPGSRSQSSASDVAEAFRASGTQERRGLRSGGISGGMLMPGAGGFSSNQQEVARSIISDSMGRAKRNHRTIRSRPTVGRTIEVEAAKGMDFGQAIRKLEVMLAVNNVRKDQRRQKFHERGGAKRKRLKSERWRKYFKEGFQATVGRVKRMRRQGW